MSHPDYTDPYPDMIQFGINVIARSRTPSLTTITATRFSGFATRETEMSYDFYMAVPYAQDGDLIALSDYDGINYTYNVSAMFRKALSQDAGIRALHHRKGKDCIDWLDAAIEDMRAKPDEYKALNPKNGWGDYNGALDVLVRLSTWCREVPEALLVVS